MKVSTNAYIYCHRTHGVFELPVAKSCSTAVQLKRALIFIFQAPGVDAPLFGLTVIAKPQLHVNVYYTAPVVRESLRQGRLCT